MDNQELQIWCVNDGKRHKAELGTTLQEISKKWCTKVRDPKTGVTGPVLAALVDHKLKELSYRMVVSHEIEFIGYSHPEGRRCYIRSLCFVLQKAVRDLFPDKILVIDHSLPSGLYCELKESEKIVEGHHPFYYLKDEESELVIITTLQERWVAFQRSFLSVSCGTTQNQNLQRKDTKTQRHKEISSFPSCRL